MGSLKAPFEPKLCTQCGGEIPRGAESEARYKKRRFCTQTCANAHRDDPGVNCPDCGMAVSVEVLDGHRVTPYCAAACEARQATERGLVRCSSEALLAMLQEAGVPCEQFATHTFENYDPILHVLIDLEWWVPAIAERIVQFDAPLAARMEALRRLALMLEQQEDLERTG